MSLYDHGRLTSKVDQVVAAPLIYSNRTAIETAQASKYSCIARPVGPVNSDVLDLEVPAQGDGVFVNMKDMRLYVEAKVVRDDGADLEAADNVAPVNNLGVSLFQLTETRVNDRPLPGQSFAGTDYKGYLDVISTMSKEDEDLLQLQGWYPDTPDRHNNVGDNTNGGFVARKQLCARSRTFAISTPLQSDLLKSQNYLGPGNKLSFRLTRNPHNKVLMFNDGALAFKLKITQLYLEYTRIVTNLPPPGFETHYFPQTELARYPLGAGTTNFNLDVHSGGRMPRSVYLFFVRTDAANGFCNRNMFLLEHADINSLVMRNNGSPHPSEPLTPDFAGQKVTRELNHLFQNLGCDWTNRKGFLNRKKYLGGYTFFAWDLTPDKCNGKHIHELFKGTITIEGRCAGMDAPLTAFVYKTWDIEMTIDRSSGAPGGHALAFMTVEAGSGGP